MATSLTFDILARDRASHTLKDVGAAAEKSAERWRKFGAVVRTSGLAVAAGVTAVGAAGVKLAQGAAEDQAAALRMAIAFQNNAHATKGQIAATEDWISAQGKAKGIADDDLRPALTRMVAVTHNVAAAQRQVSLAMDISAGSGKSLDSVTAALAKAQNGSLGGLSRLGVKTKDAAGHTLTLQQVTKELSDTYQGQASKAAETMSGKTDRLKVAVSEAGESIGYKLLPVGEKLVDLANDKLVPAFNDLFDAFDKGGIDGATRQLEKMTGAQGELLPIVHDVEQAARDLGDIFVHSVIPAFQDASGVLPSFVQPLKIGADVLGFMADHADLTKTAIEALTLYLGFNKVAMLAQTAAGSGSVSMLRSLASRTALTAEQTATLGRTMRGVAGGAGMLALTAGAESSNDALKVLGTVGGSALTGFSAAGPYGLAIGAAVGGLMLMTHKTDAAATAFTQARQPALDLANSLDQITGAASGATNAQILLDLQNRGALELGSKMGLSERTLVDAVRGRARAQALVNDTLEKSKQISGYTIDSYGRLHGGQVVVSAGARDLAAALAISTDGFHANQSQVRANALATQKLSTIFKGVPARVRTQLSADGVPQTRAEVVKLNRLFGLTPKQVKILVRGLNLASTGQEINKLSGQISGLNKLQPELHNYSNSMQSQLHGVNDVARRGANDVAKAIGDGTKGAKANLAAVAPSVTSGLGPAKAAASVGGRAVGSAMKSGMISGFAGTELVLAVQAASAVRGAIAAARHAGDIHSPSRKMHEVGKMLGWGAVEGVKSQKGDLSDAGSDLISSLIKGIDKGFVKEDRVTSVVDDHLKAMVDKVKKYQQQMAQVTSTFQGFSTSVFATQAPTLADGSTGTLSIDDLLSAQDAERTKARQVNADVRRLLKMGLSRSLIQQLQAQGSSGVDQIHALAGGTAAQIRLENQLNAQTQAAYSSVGGAVGQNLYGDSLRDAQRDEHLARTIRDAFQDAMHNAKANYEFRLRGDDLIAVIHKAERNKGRAK